MSDEDIKIRWKKEDPMFDIVDKHINLGNGTMFRICQFISMSRFCVGIERIGFFRFALSEDFNLTGNLQLKPLHPDYVGEKLNLSEGDAGNIADWINAQFGIETRCGTYYEQFCNEDYPELINPIIVRE